MMAENRLSSKRLLSSNKAGLSMKKPNHRSNTKPYLSLHIWDAICIQIQSISKISHMLKVLRMLPKVYRFCAPQRFLSLWRTGFLPRCMTGNGIFRHKLVSGLRLFWIHCYAISTAVSFIWRQPPTLKP